MINLIRNTLLSVLCLQLLAFGYIKLFHKEKKSSPLPNYRVERASSKVKKKKTKETYISKNIPKKEPIKRVIKLTEKNNLTISKKKDIKKLIKKNQIKKKLLKKIINTNTKVEKYAKKFLGHKYVWGATGPKTFDCSGFTQKVYKQTIGVVIPRVSREQAKVGKYVKYSELKKGDMVFFDTTKKRLGKVNHVGIYLSDGNFIHASSGGKKVMITNFNKKRFYKNRFLWGRRIIKEHTTVATLINHKKKEES
jgi:cell wall-associated NlpC family hydrolase